MTERVSIIRDETTAARVERSECARPNPPNCLHYGGRRRKMRGCICPTR